MFVWILHGFKSFYFSFIKILSLAKKGFAASYGPDRLGIYDQGRCNMIFLLEVGIFFLRILLLRYHKSSFHSVIILLPHYCFMILSHFSVITSFLTAYDSSNPYENLSPFLSSLRLFFNNTFSFAEDKY